MPSYGTHSIHAREALSHVSHKIEINTDYIATCAIGHDFLALTPQSSCFRKAHSDNSNLFFMKMIQYIKEHNLRENEQVMAFLYGHIMHYALDTKANPLINYMTGNNPNKFIFDELNAKVIFGAWIDQFMTDGKGELSNSNYPFKGKLADPKLLKMIDVLYSDVYGYKNISSAYNFGLKALQFHHRYTREILVKHANASQSWLMLNEGQDMFQNPVSGDVTSKSFRKLYNEAIEFSVDLCRSANSYLYNNTELDKTLTVFGNLSYDTGLDCSDKRPMQYFREYIK